VRPGRVERREPRTGGGKGVDLRKLSEVTRRWKRGPAEADLALSTVLSSIGEGLVVYDRDLRFQMWNPFMERLTGLSAAEVLGREALEVFPDFADHEVIGHLSRALDGESVSSTDTRFQIPFSGREGWVVARYHPHRDTAGNIIGVISIVRDVSDRKRAEQALAASQRELSIHNRIAEVFLTVPDVEMYGTVLDLVLEALESRHGVFGYIDNEGSLVCPSMTRDIFEECQMSDKTIVFPRESWGGIWGRSLSTKTSILSNVPGEVPQGHIAIERCIFVPIVDREELIGLLAVANRSAEYVDSDRVFMESIARRIGPILHARLARDREEKDRLRAEEEVRASARRYRAVVDQQTELVERFKKDGTVTFANDAMCRFFGVTRQGLIGSKFLPLMNDEDRENMVKQLASLSPDCPIGVIEAPCVAPDGSKRWLSWTNRALFDADGDIVEYQAVGRDITEQKKAEDDLRMALADRDALLREIHHRVKNNMAVIMSMVSLQSNGLSDSASAEALAKVRGRIRAMALVHEQIYRSGDFHGVDLADYARSLIGALHDAHTRELGHVEIRRRIGKVAMPMDLAIPCGLILNELIGNSFEHAFSDGRRGEVEVVLDHCEDGQVELGVIDNGVGFDRGIGPDREAGFGLQLVGLLAQQLGGEVEIVSDDGADIRVRFSLEDQ
jgi:PAS domain S-box-containing protein